MKFYLGTTDNNWFDQGTIVGKFIIKSFIIFLSLSDGKVGYLFF
jgi:hypothetical protein